MSCAKARISNATDYTLTTLPDVVSTEKITVDAEGKALTKLMAAILNERRKEFFAEGDRMLSSKEMVPQSIMCYIMACVITT